MSCGDFRKGIPPAEILVQARAVAGTLSNPACGSCRSRGIGCGCPGGRLLPVIPHAAWQSPDVWAWFRQSGASPSSDLPPGWRVRQQVVQPHRHSGDLQARNLLPISKWLRPRTLCKKISDFLEAAHSEASPRRLRERNSPTSMEQVVPGIRIVQKKFEEFLVPLRDCPFRDSMGQSWSGFPTEYRLRA